MEADTFTKTSEVADYYDKRHARGWMDFWPDDKKKRVIDLIRSTGIGEHTRVLEYGCGVGVFAEALKQAIPTLDVYGCDISAVAISKAAARCGDVSFHKADSAAIERLAGTFDLIYTHHVLEHVEDLGLVLAHIGKLLKPGGKVLHVVPCGNEQSLEHNISTLTKGGVDGAGRFCCDDSSHVRRLTSEDLTRNCREHGLTVREALFANQFWGGVDYLTREYHWTVLGWLNPLQGKTAGARLKLLSMTLLLGGLCILRNGPSHVFGTLRKPGSFLKGLLFALAAPLAVVMYPLSVLANGLTRWLREWEWARNNKAPNGSEMYCLFERTA